MPPMTTSDDSTVTLFQALLRVCRDSAAGYATALHDLTDEPVRRELEHYRTERLKMAAELEHRIRELRGTPHPAPTLPGAIHRAWIDLKSDAAANPTAAVLAEVERGESLAVAAYRQGLKNLDLDAPSHRLLERHYELAQAAHDRVRQLRDRADPVRE